MWTTLPGLHLFGLLLLTGCGQASYEEGLAATRGQMQYFAELEDNLAQPFTSRGISIRVPLGFTPVLKVDPPAPPPADGSTPEAPKEPPAEYPAREYLGSLKFSGTVAVWQIDVPGTQSGENAEPQHGYLFLLANNDLSLNEETKEAGKVFFPLIVEHEFLQLPGVSPSLPEPTNWIIEEYPAGQQTYLTKNTFSRGKFAATGQNGTPLQVEAYLYQVGEQQIVLVWMLPLGAKLVGVPARVDPVTLTMATLKATGQLPKDPSSVGGDVPIDTGF